MNQIRVPKGTCVFIFLFMEDTMDYDFIESEYQHTKKGIKKLPQTFGGKDFDC
jgi:hypothetical protein